MALDIKASLLANPLLKKDASQREINAVDAEFERKFPSDSERGRLVLAANMWDKTHPLAVFGCGNLKSLSSSGYDSLWQDLHNFYKN
jgi:secreted Zn-dependent insulinase-like peptidase